MAARPARTQVRPYRRGQSKQRLPVGGKYYVHVLALLLPMPFSDVLPGTLHRGEAVSALWDSVLGPRVGVTRVTLRTAVSWTLLGVTQGTLAVAMRVQGMMRPFLGSLWVP